MRFIICLSMFSMNDRTKTLHDRPQPTASGTTAGVFDHVRVNGCATGRERSAKSCAAPLHHRRHWHVIAAERGVRRRQQAQKGGGG